MAPLLATGKLSLASARHGTRWLARPLHAAMRRRARIVQRNLELCFPEIDARVRHEIQQAHFRYLAEMVGETAFAWRHPGRLGEEIGRVTGVEHFERARADGRGLLLVTAHVTALELGARVLGQHVSGHCIYRPARNPVIERAQREGRKRYAEGMIAHRDVRAMVRHLRGGGVLWYAPDQDPGPGSGCFIPFFGVAAATATGMLDLARMGRARVLPMLPVKNAQTGRITVHLEPAFENFPSQDPVVDLTRYHEFLERHLRPNPAQYWWLHRRFKTAPEGDPPRYPTRP